MSTTPRDDGARRARPHRRKRQVRFAGDRVSSQQATDAAEAATGKRFERRSLGSEAELRSAMAAAKSDLFKSVILAYQLYMLNGQTALENLQSGRYPDLGLQRFDAFLAERLAGAGR